MDCPRPKRKRWVLFALLCVEIWQLFQPVGLNIKAACAHVQRSKDRQLEAPKDQVQAYPDAGTRLAEELPEDTDLVSVCAAWLLANQSVVTFTHCSNLYSLCVSLCAGCDTAKAASCVKARVDLHMI